MIRTTTPLSRWAISSGPDTDQGINVGKYLLIFVIGFQSLYGFWPFDWFVSRDPLPPYVLEHPQMNQTSVYGVGNGKSFLEAKSKALNDIATQLRSDVRSITSVHKRSDADATQTDQQITVLTKRTVENYEIMDESHANGEVYLLVEYRR